MNTLNGYPLHDARDIITNRMRFYRDSIQYIRDANSFYCPRGKYPSRGWILLRRSDYDQLDKYSTSLTLELNSLKLYNLAIVQAQCVTRGLASDPGAIYLIELTDARGLVANKWFQYPATANYNIRADAYPQTFYQSTMDGGTTWTWARMLTDLWPNLLGTFPSLPVTPNSTPEGFWLLGTSAWEAINSILAILGLTVVCDPTKVAPFSIADQTSATDTTLQLRYANFLEDDLEWLDIGAARLPKTVVVLFKRRNAVYGTEETVRYDSLQWLANLAYSVPVTVNTSAVGMHYLWSDFTVRYGQDSVPLAIDTAQAALIANDRAAQYYATIAPAIARVYSGALPFVTGSQVDGVCWSLGNDLAWRTTVIHGQYPPWPELYEI